jgi:hypothetical protein
MALFSLTQIYTALTDLRSFVLSYIETNTIKTAMTCPNGENLRQKIPFPILAFRQIMD